MTKKSTVNKKTFRIDSACAVIATTLFIAVSSSAAQEVRVGQAGTSSEVENTPDARTETNAPGPPERPSPKAGVPGKGTASSQQVKLKLVPTRATSPLLPVDDGSPPSVHVTWENGPTPSAVRATPGKQPFSESGGALSSPPADAAAISLRNALAQPNDRAADSFQPRGQRQDSGEALPRLAVNRLIVSLLNKMPQGGDYRASSESIQKLEDAIKTDGDHLTIDAGVAKPSFCSAATYLVFVSALDELNKQGQIRFGPGVAEQLLVRGQHDGVGVWGRWNANGPGTACLFKELQLGRNFTNIEDAQAGDFLKLFWNDQIGAKEFGHSVVFLGKSKRDGIEFVQYWSSNKNGGYGRAEVPRSKIKRMLFSRFEHPERINWTSKGLQPDNYLASMLTRSSTPEEMEARAGISSSARADSTPAATVGKEAKGGGTGFEVDRKKEQ